MFAGIYIIRNTITGLIYVGSTVDARVRWRDHKCDLRHNRHHCAKLQRAWNKYGQQAFTFEVVELVSDKAILRQVEQVWIDRLRPFERTIGYNMTPTAGSLTGFKMPDIGKAKISAALKGRPKSAEARANMCGPRGRISDEIRARMSLAQKGRVKSPEHLAAIAAAIKTSPSAIAHLAKIQLMKNSPEAKEKFRATWREKMAQRQSTGCGDRH